MNFLELLANLKLIWMKELEESELQTINLELLSRLRSLISGSPKLSEDADEIHREAYLICNKIIQWILNDIRLIRRLKILLSALLQRRIYGNMLPEEEVLIETLSRTLQNIEEEVKVAEDPLEKIRVNVSVDRKMERKLILTQSSLKNLVGLDGVNYRGLREKAIINIPQKNYELLVERNARIKPLN
ncbi:MAG: hypothetical protein NDP13_02540 [Crenarchaeota archaeon]|nr:hypothetical protein [Thermoproteota archaeon]MCR8453847.1 hypothetical protein [Thermoproteota archaeon]MCR8455334.1 hypothetical protein [Thermoproteota archaeon]MCR8462604.1 hypothetical protein [Thermoproteota archaeon]MCR8472375.1 hypothetical protein [Thermoproteota archaeon]